MCALSFQLKESLMDSLVDDDESNGWELVLVLVGIQAILLNQDLFQLLELLVDDHLSHGVSHTISVDENVVRQLAVIEILVSLESSCEVLGKDLIGDDLLALLRLRTSLGVVLAHVCVVGGSETDDALTALVANIDTYKHGLL